MPYRSLLVSFVEYLNQMTKKVSEVHRDTQCSITPAFLTTQYWLDWCSAETHAGLKSLRTVIVPIACAVDRIPTLLLHGFLVELLLFLYSSVVCIASLAERLLPENQKHAVAEKSLELNINHQLISSVT